MNKNITKYIIIIFIIFIIIWIDVNTMIIYKPKYNYLSQEKFFYNTDDTPFQRLKILEQNYKIIVSEIPHIDITKVTVKRDQTEWIDKESKMVSTDILNKISQSNTWIEGWKNDESPWYNYPLIVNGIEMGNCPKTIQLLKMCGMKINIAGFTLLTPKTKLRVHNDPNTGISSNSAAFNMILSGEDCNLYIKDKNDFIKHTHEIGKAVMFNSEIYHYPDNNGSTNRYLLYMDIGYLLN
jgi:hypothetical protein